MPQGRLITSVINNRAYISLKKELRKGLDERKR